jgi:hypothetical protein
MKLVVAIAAMLALAVPAVCQRVTAEDRVRIDGKIQRVRKINGRWWSDDNRQLTKSQGGFIWWISSEKGKGFQFHHHRPVDLAKAETLHLFMDPATVMSILGEPNFTGGGLRPGESFMWQYYAENGVELSLQFIRDELAIAKYNRSDFGVSGRPVQSVEQDLGGQSVFKLMADKAGQQLRRPGSAAAAAAASTTTVRTVSVTPDPPKRRVSSEVAASVKEGMTRADVVRLLGEATGGMQIAGGENDYEDLSYALDPTGELLVRLEKGKVVRISR